MCRRPRPRAWTPHPHGVPRGRQARHHAPRGPGGAGHRRRHRRARRRLFMSADGRRLERHAAAGIVRRVALRAGIDKRVGTHTLRHAFITSALDAGVPLRDVQEAASHADPRTTCATTAAASPSTGTPPTSSPPSWRAPAAERRAAGRRVKPRLKPRAPNLRSCSSLLGRPRQNDGGGSRGRWQRCQRRSERHIAAMPTTSIRGCSATDGPALRADRHGWAAVVHHQNVSATVDGLQPVSLG
jgi:Phage integrase family